MQIFGPEYLDPADEADETLDWTLLLGADTLAASSWSVAPAGPTLVDGGHTTTTATVRFKGGAAATDYVLTNSVVLASGQKFARGILVRVRT
jgi:hypothetical protein